MADQGFPPTALRKQPNSLHCFACGIENSCGLQIHFYDNGEDEVYANYTVPEQFQGYPGRVHGGILATMLDELVGRAVMARDPNTFMVSAKLTVRYRKPVPTGQPLKLSGKVIRRRGRIATSKAEIRLPDGTVGAEAEAMLVYLEGFEIESEELDELGWKVYSDAPEEDTPGGGDENA
jgi:uncharacterized protein (TIGR00369 family)